MLGLARGWAFIDLAALGANSWRSYLVTVLRVAFVPSALLAAALAVFSGAAARHLLTASTARDGLILSAFAAEIAAGVTLAWSIERSHRRPWLSLVATDLRLDWRRLAIGAGVEGTVLVAFTYAVHLLTGQTLWVGTGLSLPVLAGVLLLVPFQAASEEMLFRGYLTQGLGRIFRNRGTIVVGVGLVFGALHFNAYGPLTLPYVFLLSVILSVVSLRDERIELTIGAHSALNWIASATDAFASRPHQLRLAAFAALIVNGALFYVLTRLLVRLCCSDEKTG